MTPRRKKITATLGLLAALACGFVVFSAFSIQGQGTLAQAPLNISVTANPAFIMAVDDSNSMVFERIFPGGDMRFGWDSNARTFFYNGQLDAGATRCANTNCGFYHYLFPHSGYNNYYGSYALPPLDEFGFARSHAYNSSYFNPFVTYNPWMQADGTRFAAATVTATRADPRSGYNGYNVTYDLTGNRARTGNGESFAVLPGMRIPNLAGRGMRYYSNGDWRTQATSFNNSVYVPFDYFPATFYLPVDAAPPPGYKTANANRPIVEDACGSGCDMRRYEIKSGNYETGYYQPAIQNFANWFQFHRNRILAMVGAMSESMQPVNNMSVGYFTINSRNAVTMRDLSSNDLLSNTDRRTPKQALFDTLTTLQANGGTPNRSAVAFLGQQFRRTDAGAPVVSSCQKNAGMLFTDGYTNSSDRPGGYGNVDGNRGTPFADSYSDTIADIAASYYDGDNVPLRGGNGFAAGKVLVPDQCKTLTHSDPLWKQLDCQADLHMNFYGVTLGAQGRIYDVDTAATANPYVNPPNWNSLPNPTSTDDGTTVDEIWHGTVNTRGEFVNAQTPADITEAMRRILTLAGTGSAPSGGIAMTGSRIGPDSFSVVPFYESTNNSTDWYGKLTAQGVATSGTSSSGLDYTTLWEASSKLPAAAERKIYYGTTAGMQAFTATNVGTAQALCSNTANSMAVCTASIGVNGITNTQGLGITLADAVAYLRGDPRLETSSDTPLRTRTTRLGDIVNSSPVISAGTDDYGYRSMFDAASNSYDRYGYAAYLQSKRSRDAMVYAGANDGMLHAFNGRTGVETFAYIPQTALGHMGNLLFPYDVDRKNNQIFQHRYFVDGAVAVSDVAYAVNNWKTVLVGAMGAGGKGAFALDVTTPSSFGTSANGNTKLWEVNDRGLDLNVNNNIGYVLGRPVIVPVKSGNGVRWKAIFGNGYGSSSGVASLFVVDIQSGRVNVMTAAEASGSGVSGSNGLGNIVVVDRWSGVNQDSATRDGMADTVYAADQQGSIWRFDLRSMTELSGGTVLSAVQSVAGTPVFTATDGSGARQPITGGLQASAGPGGGVMLYFGTGSFSFNGDQLDTSQQTFYGVVDSGRATTIRRSNLQAQTFVSQADGSKTVSSRVANGVGWYLDLAEYGERVVGYPELANGSVFFTTFDLAQGEEGCGASGNNWLYELNALSGGLARPGGTSATKLKTTGDQPIRDVVVVTTPGNGVLGEDATDDDVDEKLGKQCTMVVQAAGADPIVLPRACGRQSWRQVK